MARAYNTITKGKIKYQLNSITNGADNFTWNWNEHCEIQPDCEMVYEEDKNGQEYVIYTKGDNIVGEFLNED